MEATQTKTTKQSNARFMNLFFKKIDAISGTRKTNNTAIFLYSRPPDIKESDVIVRQMAKLNDCDKMKKMSSLDFFIKLTEGMEKQLTHLQFELLGDYSQTLCNLSRAQGQWPGLQNHQSPSFT